MSTIVTFPRVRQDLVWVKQGSGATARWIVEDPLNGSHYYFSMFERELIELLSGEHSITDICNLLMRRKPGTSWSQDKVRVFVQLLVHSNLVLVEQYGKGQRLAENASLELSQLHWGWLRNPLAIRVPLFRPQTLLQFLDPIAKLLFHPLVIATVCFAAIFLAMLVYARWTDFESLIPSFKTMFVGDRWVYLILSLAIVKSIHELGHALACYRFAGKCGEIGVLILAFTPCLYCDVSPSWMTSERWKRIVIALAGFYFELIISIFALSALLVAKDDTSRAFSIYLLFICTIGTVALNINPLVKYDGYFALADWLRIPNLADQATEAVHYLMKRSFWKSVPSRPTLDGSLFFLASYWCLSLAYRVVLFFALLWGVNLFLKPYGLEFVVYYVAVITLLVWFRKAASAAFNAIVRASASGALHKKRAGLTAFVLCMALFVFAAVPFESEITARGVVGFSEMEPFFAPYSGRITETLGEPQSVHAQQVVAKLKSIDLEQRRIQLEGEIKRLKQRISLKRDLATLDPEFDLQIPVLEESIRVTESQLVALDAEIDLLQITAGKDGFWFHAPPTDEEFPSAVLPKWYGSPLEKQNIGSWVEKGTLLGWLVDRQKPRFELYLSESDVSLLSRSDTVWIRLDHDPWRALKGVIVDVGSEPIEEVPTALIGDWQFQGTRLGPDKESLLQSVG